MSEPVEMNGQQPPHGRGRPPRGEARSRPAARAGAGRCRKRPPDELEVLIRARYPIIYVVTWEEERLEQRLLEIAKKRNKTLHIWTCSQGVVQLRRRAAAGARPGRGNTCDPVAGLDAVLNHVDPAIFLFKDLHDHLDVRVCAGNLRNIRRLRDVAPRAARHVQDDRARLADHEDPDRALQGRRRGRVRHAVGRRLQRAARSDHRRRQGPAADHASTSTPRGARSWSTRHAG